MKQLYKKITLTIAIVTLFFLYGAVMVFATPPTSQYYPSEILDPTCGPGDLNCSVTVGWEFDTGNNYVYNDTDFIGIGTDTPSEELHIAGDTYIESTLPSGGLGYTFFGDLTTAGRDGGFGVSVIDSLAINQSGSFFLDYDSGNPNFSISLNNGINSASLTLDSDDGDIYLNGDDDIGIYGAGGVTLGSSGGDISVAPNNDFYLNSGNDVFATAINGWYGGVDDEPLGITAGNYQTDFSMDPYNATPANVWALTKNQEYSLGFAAIDDDGNKRYSNIYYGTMDAGNIITDIARVEAADIGSSIMYIYDVGNDYRNYLYVNTSGISLQTQDGSGTYTLDLEADGDVHATVLEGGATTLSVDANGNIIRTPSDETLKTDIEDLDDSLERVMQLNPVTYTWKDQQRFGEQIEIGFIAQEIEEVVPEVVRSGGEYKSVNYQVLTALNAGAIKDLATQLSERAVKLIDDVKEIFVKKVTTEELCIEDVCIDKQDLLDILDDRDVRKSSEPEDDHDDEDEELENNEEVSDNQESEDNNEEEIVEEELAEESEEDTNNEDENDEEVSEEIEVQSEDESEEVIEEVEEADEIEESEESEEILSTTEEE